MPSDIRLDPNTHDLDISQQGLRVFKENTEVVAQRIKIALLLRAGEWFADITKGVPYLQFSRNKQNKSFADSILISTIKEVEGVNELISFESTLNNTRNLSVKFTVKTDSGLVPVILEV